MRSLKRAALVAAFTVTGLVAMSSAAQAVSINTTVGSSATATSGTVSLDGWIDPSCSNSTMVATVTNAGPSTVAANITASTWSGCTVSITPDHTPAWGLSTTGTADSHVSGQLAGRVDGVAVTLMGICPFSGNLVDNALTSSHVGWNNNGAGAAQIDLGTAASLSGPCGSGTIDGTWTLQGAAAGWTIS